MANTLVYFGNHNLQKGEWNVSYNGSRNAAGIDVQSILIARGDGASVVNTRREAKTINIRGDLTVRTESTNIEDLMANFDEILSNQEEHYLRFVPEYEVLFPTNTTTGWTAGSDATNLIKKTDGYQLGGSSLGFDIDVSNSGNNYAELTYTGASFDLSGKTKETSNIEFWLNIPDVFYVTSIDFRIGSDSSNYYSQNFTSNYEGQGLKSGISLLSAKFDDMAVTGSPADAALDYCYIKVNYGSDAIDVSDCYLDGIMWVNEDRLRNFLSYRQGEIKKEGESYNNTFTAFDASFFCKRGAAESTHSFELFNELGIVATSFSKTIDIDGSLRALPLNILTINDATEVASFEISSLDNQQSVSFLPDTISDGETLYIGGLDNTSNISGRVVDFEGVFPDYNLGGNRFTFNVTGNAEGTTSFETYDTDYSTPSGIGAANTLDRRAQSFVAGTTGDITSLSNYGYYVSSIGPVVQRPSTVAIYSDSGGSLGTLLGSAVINFDSTIGWKTQITTAIPVTSGTTYWIVTPTFVHTYVWVGFVLTEVAHEIKMGGDSAAGYASGVHKTSTDGGATLSAATTYDTNFRITIQPSPSWDVDWKSTYKKLYTV